MTTEPNDTPESDKASILQRYRHLFPEGGSKSNAHYRTDRLRRRADIRADRMNATPGQKVAEYLLSLMPDNLNTPQGQMFSEIVSRCAFDAAGNMYASNEKNKKYNAFDDIFRAVKKQFSGESAYRKVLNYVPLYKKGVVQTPHPTETLNRQAIKAEIELHHALEEKASLFATAGNSGITPDASRDGDLKKYLEKLYKTMEPVREALTIDDEMTRSIAFSELAFNAVPHIMNGILDPAIRTGVRNTAPLTFDELRHFGHLIEACTWSPGDRDSKPDMTVDNMQRGLRHSHRLLGLQYAIKIAEILTDERGIRPTNAGGGNAVQAKGALQHILSRILADPEVQQAFTSSEPDKPPLAEKFFDTYLHGNGGTPPGHQQREKVVGHLKTEIDFAKKATPPEASFASAAELLQEMEKVRQTHGVKFPSFNGSEVVSQLDVLVAQMHAFGDYALRSQIRENSDMHAKVMDQVLAMPEVAPHIPAGSGRKQKVEALIEMLCNPTRKDDGDRIRSAIAARIKAPQAGTERDDVYETLAGMQLAAHNPEAIPQYLIAECHNSTNLLEAFALMKLVEPGNKKLVEIVPLIEYREDVETARAQIKEAYDNPHFMAHHVTIGEKSEALQHERSKLDVGGQPQYDRLTVAEVKKAYGLGIKPGDDKKPIEHTKMVMFAGSDIMKSAGPAGAAITQQAIESLREDMLNWEHPVLLVDYTGSGGGLHRSQPVSTSFETTQGRSMRQTAGSIAQKAIVTMGRFVSRMLGLPEKPHEPRLAQLNLGNMAGFRSSPDAWKNGTGERAAACMDAYEGLYNSPEFACMLAFSADKFVKLTSYAARPLKRTKGSQDTEEYPPIVDVKNLRAIGYGAALNVSGSCTSLYYGVGKFLHADEILSGKEDITPLLTRYLEDPKAQDVINRATFGIAMSDMQTAWRYVGMERDVANGIVIDKTKGEKVSITDMAQGTESVRELLRQHDNATAGLEGEARRKASMEWLGKLDFFHKNNLARYALAKVDIEHQNVSRVLLKLHALAAGKPVQEADMPHIHQQIAELLPKALNAQITDSRKHIEAARTQLADMFWKSLDPESHDILRNPDIKMIRNTAALFDPIYYNMGACFECFENAPRAYTRPHWAAGMENSVQPQPAK